MSCFRQIASVIPDIVNRWYNLTEGGWNVSFISSNPDKTSAHKAYPSALIRFSLSSIAYPSHVEFRLDGEHVDLSDAFPPAPWEGSLDRRWLEIPLTSGLPSGKNSISVELTEEGLAAKEGQGGKMITSLEIMEYGSDGR